MARNSSLARPASSTCRVRRRCSEMSRAIFDAPMIVPSAARTGETVSEISIELPSLRCRIVSKCSTARPERIVARTLSSSDWRSAGMIDPNRLPDDLLSGIAEHPLGGAIPRLHHSVQVLADNGVFGRVHDRGEPQRLALECPLLRYVADDTGRADQIPVRGHDGRQRHRNRHAAAIAGETDCLEMAGPLPALHTRATSCLPTHEPREARSLRLDGR